MPSTVAAQLWNNQPILGPYSLPITNLSSVARVVLPADKARKGLIIHNPGTANKRIVPAGGLLTGSKGILIYPQTEYQLLQKNDSEFNINVAWEAVTDDDGDPSLTILDFTPNTPGAPEVRPTSRLLMQNGIDSPDPTQVTVGMGGIALLPADPNRMGVQFINPGVNVLAVCPDNVAPSIGAGSIILLPGQTKTIIGNDRVRVNCGWSCIAQAGADNEITALSLFG